MPIIFAGDLNTLPGSNAIQTILYKEKPS